ncbi:hypothetical protein CDAR_508741 [Caerostris darwini]|uniref:Uncharacterized protein n=1 Tax=Caerostris darwini TaxID=1538125 RepID=A0AAV4N0Z8_9ARAC|nr:hypothetical protein CDAR_508741 [Caerostris darwini]
MRRLCLEDSLFPLGYLATEWGASHEFQALRGGPEGPRAGEPPLRRPGAPEGGGGGWAARGPPDVRGLPAAELAVLLERMPDPQRGQPGVPGVPGARYPTRRGHRVRPGGGALGLEAQGAQAPQRVHHHQTG